MSNGTIAVSQLEMLTQSGTGTITINPPNTDTDRVLTLPDVSGTVVSTGSAAVVTETMLAAAVVPLGVGQTWQNVTASRASGTTYTNSTGRPMCITATAVSGASSGLFATVAGAEIARQYSAITGWQFYPAITFIVPVGATYSISLVVVGTFRQWFELR